MLALTEDAVARFVEEAVERRHSVGTGRSGPELRKELARLERACREMGRDEYTAQVGGGSRVKAVRLDPDRLALPPKGCAGGFDEECSDNTGGAGAGAGAGSGAGAGVGSGAAALPLEASGFVAAATEGFAAAAEPEATQPGAP